VKYRGDVDGLRSIALLSVIAYHYSIGVPGYGLMVAPGGFVGVDIFFVISGYLITETIYSEINGGVYSAVGFYARRVRRIFPAMFAVFVFIICAASILYLPGELTKIGGSMLASIFFVSNFAFYNSAGYFDQQALLNPLLHTWSLSIEEQFYLLFPLLVAVLRSRSHATRIRLMFGIALASLGYSVWKVHVDQAAAFYLVQSRAWELLLGSLLAIGEFPRPAIRWHAELLGALGICLVVGSVERISSETAFPGLAAVAPCIGAAAILHSGATATTWTGRILGSPPLRFVGVISYSLYLWHWPLIVFFRFYREPIGIEKVALIAVCFVLATISWRFIERPPRERPYRLSAYGTLAAGGGVMAAASVVALMAGPTSRSLWSNSGRAEALLAYEDYDGPAAMRDGVCFLSSRSDNFSIYDNNSCLALRSDQKNFLIVGDSHAAHLWHGLHAVFQKVNFLQATASGCKPVVGSLACVGARSLSNSCSTSFCRTTIWME
jgi:peptidoglycan/LPS O-acetylase OafA/YrhL